MLWEKQHQQKNLKLKYNDFRICVELPIKAKLNSLKIYIQARAWKEKGIAGKKSKCRKRWFFNINCNNYFIFKKSYILCHLVRYNALLF